jgi:hypothetical protein
MRGLRPKYNERRNCNTVCRMYKNGRTNVRDEVRSGRSSVVNDDQKISERRRFTIAELSYEFPQISRTVLYEIFTVRLGYDNLCASWIPKMLMRAYIPQRMALALTSLERHHKDGDEHPNPGVRTTEFSGHLNLHRQRISVVDHNNKVRYKFMQIYLYSKINILSEFLPIIVEYIHTQHSKSIYF